MDTAAATDAPTLRQMRLSVVLSTGLKALEQKRYQIAERIFRDALARKPWVARGLLGLGRVLAETQRLSEAFRYFKRLALWHPANAAGVSNVAYMLSTEDRFHEAARWYRRACIASAGDTATRIALGITLLRIGDWERGFDLYDLRDSVTSLAKGIGAERVWDGSQDPAGKRVMICGEQGFGDHIQFARYAALLKEAGAHVLLLTRDELREVLSWVPFIDEVVGNGDSVDFDLAVMAMSLPRIFGTRPDHVPMTDAYIVPPPNRKAIPGEAPGRRMRVGVAWRGNPANSRDFHRSCPYSAFRTLICAFPEIDFYPLQKDLSDVSAAPPANLRLDGPDLASFADTARALSGMDLVISVDTSLAHLAGALGLPTWILIARQPDWRWLDRGERCLWYRSGRLFRMREDWSELVNRVAEQLRATSRQPD